MEEPVDHDGRIAEILQARLGGNTRRGYLNANQRFAAWCQNNENGLYSNVVENGHIVLSRLTLKIIESFLGSKYEDEKNDISALNSYRSALKMLYKDADTPFPYDAELTDFFSGLKRMCADRKRQGTGGRNPTEGKEDLPFGVYRQLMKQLLRESEQPHSHFTHELVQGLPPDLLCGDQMRPGGGKAKTPATHLRQPSSA